jgi:hypothetical protein
MSTPKRQANSHRRVSQAPAPVQVRSIDSNPKAIALRNETYKDQAVRAARAYLIQRLQEVRDCQKAFDRANKPRNRIIADLASEREQLQAAIQAGTGEITRLAARYHRKAART